MGFPEDFKEIVGTYAPVQLNGHLYLSPPATERWNLAEWIRGTSRAWSQIARDEGEPEGEPRVQLGTSNLAFGAPDGLIPLCSTDRGEEIFYAPRGALGQGSLFIENGEGEFFEYSFSFAEWLYRWLTGPGGSAFYPDPTVHQYLPMTQASTGKNVSYVVIIRWTGHGAGYVELDCSGWPVGDREAADPAVESAAARRRNAGYT